MTLEEWHKAPRRTRPGKRPEHERSHTGNEGKGINRVKNLMHNLKGVKK